MKIKKFNYSQYIGQPHQWQIENCSFGDINLIVGKNATGKTRTLNVIRALARLVSQREKLRWSDGTYDVQFSSNDQTISYKLSYSNNVVVNEELFIDNELKLRRDPDSTGIIYAQDHGDMLKFQSPNNEVVVASRDDAIQHPYLQTLQSWGKSISRYNFGTDLGVKTLYLPDTSSEVSDLDLPSSGQVVHIFSAGIDRHPDLFKQTIIDDMRNVGYKLEDVFVAPIQDLRTEPRLPIDILSLFVSEKGIGIPFPQIEMSQGMFRTLSILIQVNFSLLVATPSCILIDDIGEGLDYERSSSFVKVIMAKATDADIQLIMTSNHNFIMNAVPIEYWIIPQPQAGIIVHLNYRNSKKLFDDFELTGLGNFDLLTSDYLLQKLEDQNSSAT